MFLLHRKSLAGIGFTAVAVASTALFAVPAQAASAGLAKVVGSSTVQFNALMGKSNSLSITISGRTVTLNDKVAIKAGKGCKAVKGDKTKVKCTTPKKTTKLSVALGDKNDSVGNATSVYMLTDGGTGNDTLTGGSGKDQLQGGTGNDKLYGKGGNDTIFGGSGNDLIVGSSGDDEVEAGSGNDTVSGDAGNDLLLGEGGRDRLAGGNGDDDLIGGDDVDTIYGEAGEDAVIGQAGNDVLSAGAGDDLVGGGPGNDTIGDGAGDDFVFGDAGNDRVNGAAGDDVIYGQAGNDTLSGSAGDDQIIGEDLDIEGNKIGSNSALDVVDGGANRVEGDLCLVMAAGTTSNCEFGVEAGAARTATATNATAVTPATIKAVQQAKAELAAVQAGK
jgi:Ca2+-binding RTX toxin-like protein